MVGLRREKSLGVFLLLLVLLLLVGAGLQTAFFPFRFSRHSPLITRHFLAPPPSTRHTRILRRKPAMQIYPSRIGNQVCVTPATQFDGLRVMLIS
jgi:hypothetical protein